MRPIGTIYRRALRRVDRRRDRVLASPLPLAVRELSHEYQLLVEAVRLANDLAR